MIAWPDTADQEVKNPVYIEKFLYQQISDSQVTLLGEIDLDAITNYGAAGWSLRELANYLFEKPIVRNRIQKWHSGDWEYPATTAIWAVSQAQHLEDGNELWPTSTLSFAGRIRLAQAFTHSIERLGLEKFEGQLEGMQRHMTLARLHAIIPNFALEKFSSYIRRATEYHQPYEIALESMRYAQDLSRSVTKLFEAKPELGRDLIERSVQTVRHRVDAGLPPRLTSSLLLQPPHQRLYKITTGTSLPVVALDENTGELYLKGINDWNCKDNNQLDVNVDRLPCLDILAARSADTEIRLLDVSDGYLIFNHESEKMDNHLLPAGTGIILWSDIVSFDEYFLTTEPLPFDSWSGWKIAHFNAIPRLQIRLTNGILRNLVARKSLEIISHEVPNLLTSEKQPVFAKVPILGQGQMATAINNLSSTRTALGPEPGPISVSEFGPIDVTVYAGLGRSQTLKGLLIPGLVVRGDFSPLLKKEIRTFAVVPPVGWNGDKEVLVTADEGTTAPHFTLVDPNGTSHEISLNIPKLTWSIEFTGSKPDLVDFETIYQISEIKNLRRLVIHGAGLQIPNLYVKDPATEKPLMLLGKIRNQDCLFDLQLIQDARNAKEISLQISINGKRLVLARFLSRPPSPPKVRMQRVELKDLATVAVEKGIISEEDWANFAIARKQASAQLIKSIRERRR